VIVTNKVYTGQSVRPGPSPGPRSVQAYEIAATNGASFAHGTIVIEPNTPAVVHAIVNLAIAAQSPMFLYRHEGTILQGVSTPSPGSSIAFETRSFCGRNDTVESFGVVAPSAVTCPECAAAIAPSWKRRIISWRSWTREVVGKTLDAVRSVLVVDSPVPQNPHGTFSVDARFTALGNMIGSLAAEVREMKRDTASVSDDTPFTNMIQCGCGHVRVPDPASPYPCPGCGIFPATAESVTELDEMMAEQMRANAAAQRYQSRQSDSEARTNAPSKSADTPPTEEESTAVAADDQE